MGGPIALVEEGDLIHISIEQRKIEIVGIQGEKRSAEEIEHILKKRKENWRPKSAKYTKGIMKQYTEHAVSPMKGAYME